MRSQNLPLIAFFCLTIGLWAAMQYQPSRAPAMATPLPPMPLQALDGETRNDAWSPDSGRVSIVNFFASWCTPCRAEHPQLKALSARKDVALHGIAWNDTAAHLTAFLEKYGNPYDSVWRDDTGKAAISVGLRGVPESYVIGRDGKIRLHIRGAISPTMLPELEALLDTLQREEIADATARP